LHHSPLPYIAVGEHRAMCSRPPDPDPDGM